MSITEGNPDSSAGDRSGYSGLKRNAWDTTLPSTLELRSTADEFHIQESISAWRANASSTSEATGQSDQAGFAEGAARRRPCRLGVPVVYGALRLKSNSMTTASGT